MLSLSKKLDQLLLDLAWSLWTELGVAGVLQRHAQCLITLEELICLTAALGNIDPRLRDESLDWCSQYHHFVSISRLRSIAKGFGDSFHEPFATYCATLNSVAGTSWPLFQEMSPLKIILSHKSHLESSQSPALLTIRARYLFGTGARADVATFFLTQAKSDFSASDVTEIGYSKRNLAQILEEFCLSGLFEKFPIRNQQRYRLIKNGPLTQILGPLPNYAPSWRIIFEFLFSLRDCLHRNEKSADRTKVVEIHSLFVTLQKHLHRLHFTPPLWKDDFQTYLDASSQWIIETVGHLARCEFSNHSFLTT
jgi:hypothetical protein